MCLVGLSKSLIICGFLICIIMVKCEDILDTFTLSSVSLDTADYHQFGAYHANTDTIWILGGLYCSTCVYSYDPSEDSITQHTDITGGYNWNQDNSVIIGDLIYFITYTGDLASYDVSSGSETNPLVSDTLGLEYPCLVKNEDETQLYVVNGNDDIDFYIYDIENEVYYSGPDLNNDRNRPSCTVDSNNFLYVSFGYEDKIERINLTYFSSNSNTEYNDIEWEVLTSDTTDPIFEEEIGCDGDYLTATSSIQVFGNIYIITGYCATSSDNDGMIIKLDTDSFELSFIGRTPVEMRIPKVILSKSNSANDRRIYMFGGYTTAALDSIYYSNIIGDLSSSSSSSSSSVFLVSSHKSSDQSSVQSKRYEKIIDNQNNIRFILFAIGILLIFIGGLFSIFIYKNMDSSIKEKSFSYQSIKN